MKKLIEKIKRYFTPKICGLTLKDWQEVQTRLQINKRNFKLGNGICDFSSLFLKNFFNNKHKFHLLANRYIVEYGHDLEISSLENSVFLFTIHKDYNSLSNSYFIRLFFINYVIKNFNELCKKY